MKLIFIIDSLKSGGAERVLSILASELSSRGYDISIFSKSHDNPFYDLNHKINLIVPKSKITYTNKFVTLIERTKVYAEIFHLLRTGIYDLVISFSTTTNGIVIPICKILTIPVIACEHTNYKANMQSFFKRFIKRRIYPFANCLTVLTERDKNGYYANYLKNVVVMPNPLSMKPITYNTYDRKKVIVAVGHVASWKIKGFDNLLKIYAELIKKFPFWKLKIAGGGDDTFVKKLIKELDISEHVSLLGQISDVEKLMKESEIFVLTSRWEGLPMGLLEAMSQGMTCIAFDCYSGPKDLIKHNFDGVLVEDQSNTDFAHKLSELIKDPDFRLFLGNNAIEASKKYLPSFIVDKWEKLISNVVENL